MPTHLTTNYFCVYIIKKPPLLMGAFPEKFFEYEKRMFTKQNIKTF